MLLLYTTYVGLNTNQYQPLPSEYHQTRRWYNPNGNYGGWEIDLLTKIQGYNDLDIQSRDICVPHVNPIHYHVLP